MKSEIRDKSHKLPGVFDLVLPSFAAINVNLLLYLCLLLLPGVLVSIFFGQDSSESVNSLADLQSYQPPIELYIGQGISLLLAPFVLYVQLQSARGNKVTIRQTVNQTAKKYLQLFALVVLLLLLTVLGFLLFIIPGLLILKRFMLSPYYLLDENTSLLQAMQHSQTDVQRYSRSIWGVIGFGFFVAILALLSAALPILIFVLAAGQLSLSLMPALRYHQIKEQLGWTFDTAAHPPKNN